MGTTASKKFFLSLSQNPNSFDSSRYKKGGERENINWKRQRERKDRGRVLTQVTTLNQHRKDDDDVSAAIRNRRNGGRLNDVPYRAPRGGQGQGQGRERERERERVRG